MAQRLQVLSLYRDILRLHRAKLPHDMRSLGDTYVKNEFRLHREAKPAFVTTFLKEWDLYVAQLRMQRGDQIGSDLPTESMESLSDEQKEQLKILRSEAIEASRKN